MQRTEAPQQPETASGGSILGILPNVTSAVPYGISPSVENHPAPHPWESCQVEELVVRVAMQVEGHHKEMGSN